MIKLIPIIKHFLLGSKIATSTLSLQAARMTSHIMPTYNRLPVTFDRGEGAWLFDDKNNRYLDALSGIAVCNLGHAHPAIHNAICEQSKKLIHTSNIYGIPGQELLAEKLTEKSGMDNIFFCN